MDIFWLIVEFALFFLALSAHEFAHGWVAYRCGDYTIKYSGRLTLNPLAHIDPIGTFLLPLSLILARAGIVFGWAKPVPINFYLLRNPKKDLIWIGLAGPLANFIFAFLLSIIFRIFPIYILKQLIFINLILGIFNLIPIPPLDGSRIVSGLLPHKYFYLYVRLEPFGFLLIIFLFFTGIIHKFLIPLVYFVYNLLV